MAFRTTFRTYAGITILNVVLFFGGFSVGISYRNRAAVYAQQQEFEDISPVISAGSAAFGTVLAGRVATDKMIVSGYDMLKMQETVLNVIGKGNPGLQAELQVAVNAAKVSPVPRMKPELPKGPEPKVDSKQGGK